MISDDLKTHLAAHLGIERGDPDFWTLIDCALETLKQVTVGKGRDRHARGRDFVEQPIIVIPRLLGEVAGLGGLVYQAMKKSEEALKLPKDRQVAELRGAAIYALAAVMHAQSFAATGEPASPAEPVPTGIVWARLRTSLGSLRTGAVVTLATPVPDHGTVRAWRARQTAHGVVVHDELVVDCSILDLLSPTERIGDLE